MIIHILQPIYDSADEDDDADSSFSSLSSCESTCDDDEWRLFLEESASETDDDTSLYEVDVEEVKKKKYSHST